MLEGSAAKVRSRTLFGVDHKAISNPSGPMKNCNPCSLVNGGSCELTRFACARTGSRNLFT